MSSARSGRSCFSDYLADAAGNRERVGFVFNRDRVAFTGLAASAEEPHRATGGRFTESMPWWRPPFMASFAAGSLELLLVGAHVRWGKDVAARGARRTRELAPRTCEGEVLRRAQCRRAWDFNAQIDVDDGALGGLVLAPD